MSTNHAYPGGSVIVYRPVLAWKRFRDCWEAELDCGHKANTGPDTPNGFHGAVPIAVPCKTCEAVVREVIVKGHQLG